MNFVPIYPRFAKQRLVEGLADFIRLYPIARCKTIGTDPKFPDALKQDRNLLGQLLEALVFQELRRHASWHDDSFTFHHFQDNNQGEVDAVIEKGAGILAGVVLYDGERLCNPLIGRSDLKQIPPLRNSGNRDLDLSLRFRFRYFQQFIPFYAIDSCSCFLAIEGGRQSG
jgi:hypothetical protein